MKKYIIGFCGAQCTGKTSLANTLKEKYPDKIELCIEGVRESAFELGYTKDEIRPCDRLKHQQNILYKHLNALTDFEICCDKPILICDRTIYDFYGYCLRYYDDVGIYHLNHIRDLCITTNYYKRIFYFPLIDIKNTDDNFRNVQDREHMDTIISGVLFNHYEILHIKGNSLEERINSISNFIEEDILKWQI
jgi:hypothetical protein